MQLLSALDQITQTLWYAICVAAVLAAVGMVIHATGLLLKRVFGGSSIRSAVREWLRWCREALALLP